ncbi:unnamed protein product, partial [Brassica rapa subsp. narinosa]
NVVTLQRLSRHSHLRSYRRHHHVQSRDRPVHRRSQPKTTIVIVTSRRVRTRKISRRSAQTRRHAQLLCRGVPRVYPTRHRHTPLFVAAVDSDLESV